LALAASALYDYYDPAGNICKPYCAGGLVAVLASLAMSSVKIRSNIIVLDLLESLLVPIKHGHAHC
jgi:hypothetical protein